MGEEIHRTTHHQLNAICSLLFYLGFYLSLFAFYVSSISIWLLLQLYAASAFKSLAVVQLNTNSNSYSMDG